MADIITISDDFPVQNIMTKSYNLRLLGGSCGA